MMKSDSSFTLERDVNRAIRLTDVYPFEESFRVRGENYR